MAEGLRPITVNGQRFRWRFDERLVIIPADRSGPQLRVEWGWRDWLETDGPGGEPLVVTPKFVADAIKFALSHGWTPEASRPPLLLGFEDGCFRLSADRS